MNMTTWDWLLYGLAGLVAVRALFRILLARRSDYQAELIHRIQEEQQAKREKAKAEAAKQAKELEEAEEQTALNPSRRAA